MAILKLATLLTQGFTPIDVRYADVVQGQYGVQLRLRGHMPSDPQATLFVDLVPANDALLAAGVIQWPLDVGPTLPHDVTAQLGARKLVVGAEAAGRMTRFLVRANGAPLPNAAAAPRTNGGTASAPRPPQIANGTNGAAGSGEKLSAIYLQCVDFVLDKVLPRFRDRQIEVVDEAAARMIATLFEERCRGARAS